MILLAALTLSFLQTDHEKNFMEGLSFTVTVDGERIRLVPWENEEEQAYYLFLPSGFREKNPKLVVSFEKGMDTLLLDGVPCKSGDIFYPIFEEKDDAVPINMEITGLFGVSYMSKSLKILLDSTSNVSTVSNESEFGAALYLRTSIDLELPSILK